MADSAPGRLADRLHSAAIHLLRRLRRTDPQTGVSAAQLSALSILMSGKHSLGDLAAAEQVQPPTMSRLVRELERAGLVTRTRDRDDARVVWIEWTAHGRQVLTRGRELRVLALEQQIDQLSTADQRTLAQALDIVDRLLSML
ncbi:MAG TPA: MarR family transcriptional regulator [Chloroflexota bacterium]